LALLIGALKVGSAINYSFSSGGIPKPSVGSGSLIKFSKVRSRLTKSSTSFILASLVPIWDSALEPAIDFFFYHCLTSYSWSHFFLEDSNTLLWQIHLCSACAGRPIGCISAKLIIIIFNRAGIKYLPG